MNRILLVLALVVAWVVPASAVPPIKSSGPIDRAGITAGWWGSSLGSWPDPSFVADGPTATIVFTAWFNQTYIPACYDVRIDNICVATNAAVLAHTQSLHDPGPFPYTNNGPIPAFYWENAAPADVVFMEPFTADTGDFDPHDLGHFNGTDSAQSSILAPITPLPPPGGSLKLGDCATDPEQYASTAIRVEGLTPGQTYAVTFWWRANQSDDVITVDVYGHETFSDVTTDAIALWDGLQPGVAWADFRGGGFPALHLTDSNGPGGNPYLKNVHGSFNDGTGPPTNDPADGTGIAAADIDGDGELDLYTGNNGDPNRLFRGGQGHAFTDATASPTDDLGPTYPVSFVDYDRNGTLDLYIGQLNQPNRMFRGGDGLTFTDVTTAPLDDPGLSAATSWADFDDDGDMDLYLGNWAGDKLLRNDNGVFVDVTAMHEIPQVGITRSADWGDMDNDGDLDLYLGVQQKPNVLLRNDNGILVNATSALLADDGACFAAHWVDYDNDGWLDIFVTNQNKDNLMFRGIGAGEFVDATTYNLAQGGRQTVAAAWADFDCDGWLDVYMSQVLTSNRLVTNQGGTNAWLQVDLQSTTGNRSGVGARITVVTGSISQIREVTAGGVNLSMNSLTAEFGLGSAQRVDQLRVRWPNGDDQTLHDLDVNQKLLIVEGVTGHGPLPSLARATLHSNVPNPFNPQTALRFTLPREATVDLTIYDPRGRRVRTLLSGERRGEGDHRVAWDGRNDRGLAVASGAYLYTLRVEGFRSTRRMVLMK